MRLLLLALALAVFIVISAGLARAFSAGSQERALVGDVAHWEAAGDAAALLARMEGCRGHAPCEARVRRTTARARRPGSVRILNVAGTTKLALTGGRHVARLAWSAGAALPVVQCVGIRRSGDLASGFDVTVTSIRSIPRYADC